MKSKMNLPNKLTVLRLIMVPIFMVVMLLPVFGSFSLEINMILNVVGAFLFIAASFTDMLDGKIARKYNLVTDFGKFMDPLADKLMVFGAMLGILYRFDYIRPVFIWASLIVIFRELAITSMRLIVVNKSGTVVAAAWLGKVKTVTQVVCIVTVLLDPVIFPNGHYILSYVTITAMTVMTIWSGIDYMRAYWSLLDPNK